jgi:four helix bundle protein
MIILGASSCTSNPYLLPAHSAFFNLHSAFLRVEAKMDEKSGMDLRKRTKAYAVSIIKLYPCLPKTGEAQVIGKQLLRSGTSVGAQYREACRAKPTADFVSKMEGSLQELDETGDWLELLVEGKILPSDRVAGLDKETDELTAIFVASVKTAKRSRTYHR